MKIQFVILGLLAIGLTVLIVRKESVLRVEGFYATAVVEGTNTKIVSEKPPDVTEIDLHPYAKVGLVLVVLGFFAVVLSRRREKKS